MTIEELHLLRMNRDRLRSIAHELDEMIAKGLLEHYPPYDRVRQTKSINLIEAVKMYREQLRSVGFAIPTLMECKLAVELLK